MRLSSMRFLRDLLSTAMWTKAMIMRRVGRPGLIGVAARTAVVAGTASAVTGHAAKKQQQAAYDQQAAQQQAEQQQAKPSDDLYSQLQKLAQLRDSGVLTETEFAAAKAKLL